MALRDPGPATQCLALDEYFALPAGSVSGSDRQAVMTAAVAALEIGIHPMFTAERLGGFGDEVVAPLSELLTHTSSHEARFFAALTLLRLGSRVGLPVLLQEVEQGGSYAHPASHELANAGCADHVPFVIEELRRRPAPSGKRIPTGEDDRTLSLFSVLAKLRAPLPEDLLRRFSDSQASDYLRRRVAEMGFGEPGA